MFSVEKWQIPNRFLWWIDTQWSAEPSGRAEMQKFKIKIFGELLVLDLKLHPPGKSTV